MANNATRTVITCSVKAVIATNYVIPLESNCGVPGLFWFINWLSIFRSSLGSCAVLPAALLEPLHGQHDQHLALLQLYDIKPFL